MTRDAYTFVFLAIAIGTGVALARARKSGSRALWFICGAVIAILLGLGLWDWQSQTVRETSLESYLLVATIPAVASALMTSLLSKRLGTLALAGVATVTFICLAIGILILTL